MKNPTRQNECLEDALWARYDLCAECFIKNNLLFIVLSVIISIVVIGGICQAKETEMNITCEIIQTGLMLITALAAIWGFRQGKKTLEVANVSRINAYYASDEVFDALHKLGELSNQHADLLRNVKENHNNKGYKVPLSAEEKEALIKMHQLESRKIKFYFLNILKLYENGYLSNKSFHMLMDKNGISLFFDVIEPMEYLKNTEYDQKPFEKIRKLCYDLYEKYSESNKGFR